jgi:hypothetical protein
MKIRMESCMASDKDKKGSGDQKERNDGKRSGNDRIIKRPGDNVHGNNNNTNSTGPRSPNNGKQ